MTTQNLVKISEQPKGCLDSATQKRTTTKHPKKKTLASASAIRLGELVRSGRRAVCNELILLIMAHKNSITNQFRETL